MINTQLLDNIILCSGIKYKSLASELGISYYSLHNKINNKSEFKLSEMRKLCMLLRMNDDMQRQIFLLI